MVLLVLLLLPAVSLHCRVCESPLTGLALTEDGT